jgi:hypothetical protein
MAFEIIQTSFNSWTVQFLFSLAASLLDEPRRPTPFEALHISPAKLAELRAPEPRGDQHINNCIIRPTPHRGVLP